MRRWSRSRRPDAGRGGDPDAGVSRVVDQVLTGTDGDARLAPGEFVVGG